MMTVAEFRRMSPDPKRIGDKPGGSSAARMRTPQVVRADAGANPSIVDPPVVGIAPVRLMIEGLAGPVSRLTPSDVSPA
jgi:hypothetical protein